MCRHDFAGLRRATTRSSNQQLGSDWLCMHENEKARFCVGVTYDDVQLGSLQAQLPATNTHSDRKDPAVQSCAIVSAHATVPQQSEPSTAKVDQARDLHVAEMYVQYGCLRSAEKVLCGACREEAPQQVILGTPTQLGSCPAQSMPLLHRIQDLQAVLLDVKVWFDGNLQCTSKSSAGCLHMLKKAQEAMPCCPFTAAILTLGCLRIGAPANWDEQLQAVETLVCHVLPHASDLGLCVEELRFLHGPWGHWLRANLDYREGKYMQQTEGEFEAQLQLVDAVAQEAGHLPRCPSCVGAAVLSFPTKEEVEEFARQLTSRRSGYHAIQGTLNSSDPEVVLDEINAALALGAPPAVAAQLYLGRATLTTSPVQALADCCRAAALSPVTCANESRLMSAEVLCRMGLWSHALQMLQQINQQSLPDDLALRSLRLTLSLLLTQAPEMASDQGFQRRVDKLSGPVLNAYQRDAPRSAWASLLQLAPDSQLHELMYCKRKLRQLYHMDKLATLNRYLPFLARVGMQARQADEDRHISQRLRASFAWLNDLLSQALAALMFP